jgi:hypothetical protein
MTAQKELDWTQGYLEEAQKNRLRFKGSPTSEKDKQEESLYEEKVKEIEERIKAFDGLAHIIKTDELRVCIRDRDKCKDFLDRVVLFKTEVDELCDPILKINSEEVEDQEQEREEDAVHAARVRLGF